MKHIVGYGQHLWTCIYIYTHRLSTKRCMNTSERTKTADKITHRYDTTDMVPLLPDFWLSLSHFSITMEMQEKTNKATAAPTKTCNQ